MKILILLLVLLPFSALAAPPNLALDWTGTATGADTMELDCNGAVTPDVTPPIQLTDGTGAYVLTGAADAVVCLLVGRNAFGTGTPSQLFIGAPGAAPTLTVITQ
jgi:hypothetical protein